MNDYKHIRAWGRLMHSYNYYVEAQIDRARKERATQDAIYLSDDRGWVTFDQISDPVTKQTMERLVSEMK